MFKVNNKGTRTTSVIFIVNFERISHLFVELPLLTLNRKLFAGTVQQTDVIFKENTSDKILLSVQLIEDSKPVTFIKKETSSQAFFKTLQNNFFTEQIRVTTTTSIFCMALYYIK